VIVIATNAEELVEAAERDGFSIKRTFVANVTDQDNSSSAVSIVRLVEKSFQLVQASVHIPNDQNSLFELRRLDDNHWNGRLNAGHCPKTYISAGRIPLMKLMHGMV
jgi:hypothetical protein